MEEIKMFNHGIFQQELQNKIEEILIQRSKEIDPYTQWNLDEQCKLIEELLVKYKNSVDIQLNR